MTLLLIAYIIYSVLSIPASAQYARFVIEEHTNSTLLQLAALVFAVIALCLYMASIGHGIVALILLLPSMVSFVVGVTAGIIEHV